MTELPSTTETVAEKAGQVQEEATQAPSQPVADQKKESAGSGKRGRPRGKREPLPFVAPAKVIDALVKLEIPVAYDPENRPRRRFHTNVRDITPKQRFGLNCLMQGMQAMGVELQNGGEVRNQTNAIRAFLELVADKAREQM